LVLEFSNDGAVGTADSDVNLDPLATGALSIEGLGSFGIPEASPGSWVVLSAGSGVAGLRLNGGAGGTDEMAPVGGIAVLALPVADLTGDTIDALDASGAVLSSATVPAQGSLPVTGCAAPALATPTGPSSKVPIGTTPPTGAASSPSVKPGTSPAAASTKP
jgi:hypothetical protein